MVTHGGKKLKSVAWSIDISARMETNRHGAEAARRTHNPEVVGSKPTDGI